MKAWQRLAFSGLLASVLIHAVLLDLMRGDGFSLHRPAASLQAKLAFSSLDSKTDREIANPANSSEPAASRGDAKVPRSSRGEAEWPAADQAGKVQHPKSSEARSQTSSAAKSVAGKHDAAMNAISNTALNAPAGSEELPSLRPLSRQESVVAYRMEIASVWRISSADARPLERGSWRCVLSLALKADGQIESVTIMQGAGDEVIDRILMRGLREAVLKAALPALLKGEPLSVEFEFLG